MKTNRTKEQNKEKRLNKNENKIKVTKTQNTDSEQKILVKYLKYLTGGGFHVRLHVKEAFTREVHTGGSPGNRGGLREGSRAKTCIQHSLEGGGGAEKFFSQESQGGAGWCGPRTTPYP